MVTKGWSLPGARGWAGASPGPGAGLLLLGGPEAAWGRRQGPCPGRAGAPRAHPAVRGAPRGDRDRVRVRSCRRAGPAPQAPPPARLRGLP